MSIEDGTLHPDVDGRLREERVALTQVFEHLEGAQLVWFFIDGRIVADGGFSNVAGPVEHASCAFETTGRRLIVLTAVPRRDGDIWPPEWARFRTLFTGAVYDRSEERFANAGDIATWRGYIDPRTHPLVTPFQLEAAGLHIHGVRRLSEPNTAGGMDLLVEFRGGAKLSLRARRDQSSAVATAIEAGWRPGPLKVRVGAVYGDIDLDSLERNLPGGGLTHGG